MMNTNDSLNLNTNEVIHQIVYLAKYKNNYHLAASLFLENNLSSGLLNQKTMQLSEMNILKLKQSIIEIKNNKR